MALRGTLKDFGIADIFQLIAHQGKTGVLTLRNRGYEVLVHFSAGNLVRAEPVSRHERNLLGSMLVRAGLLTQEQLEEAIDTQRATLMRLGDVLVEKGMVSREDIKEMTRLQTTETVYGLFLWSAGVYEFEQATVDVRLDEDLIRSETILMEGFRRVDEWSRIRDKIAGYGVTFSIVEDLEARLKAEPSAKQGEDDLGFDDAFGEFDLGGEAGGRDSGLKNVGVNERLVYGLIDHDRDVQRLIDLSRLGEFETCKALVNLLDAGFIRAAPGKGGRPSARVVVGGGISPGRMTGLAGRVARPLLLAMVILVVGVVVLFAAVALRRHAGSWSRLRGFVDTSLAEEVSQGHRAVLVEALEAYRAIRGVYPPALSALVEESLIKPRDLSFPWDDPYVYQLRADGGYELLRPLF